MCGIFGYKGNKTNAGEIVLEGLKRLDYRGYDSWGVCVMSKDTLTVHKEVGKISEVQGTVSLPSSTAAIAHTRWATTGGVTQVNAHPHLSTDNSFALAQNGIVENFAELKKMLIEKGYAFVSETDTEVIVRLIEEKLTTQKDYVSAMRAAFLTLTGRNTVILITRSGEIYAARNGSPLVIGVNTKTREVFLSSDTLSFAPFVDKMIVVENGQMVSVDNTNAVQLYDLLTGDKCTYTLEDMTIKAEKIDKEGYEHFMEKEIHETPYVLRQVAQQDMDKVQAFAQVLKHAHHVYVIGSGTAGIAASQIAFYLRLYGKIGATSLIGADVQSYYDIFQPDDIIIAPSQSGETADVIEVLEHVKKKGLKIGSIINMPGSIMTRMSDYPFMCNAGPEICVMSTKVFTSQVAWGYLVAKAMQGRLDEGKGAIERLAGSIQTYLKSEQSLQSLRELARHLADKPHIFLLGKYQNYAMMQEGMVKIIEASYRHAHAIPAGDLKHYAITLIEKGMPVIVAISDDEVKNDLTTAINEVRLRGAEVIVIGHTREDTFDYFIQTEDTGETDAISNVIPLQLLAYYLAVALGNNIDKPRHIAKSVTVK